MHRLTLSAGSSVGLRNTTLAKSTSAASVECLLATSYIVMEFFNALAMLLPGLDSYYRPRCERTAHSLYHFQDATSTHFHFSKRKLCQPIT
ncbi:hypothetical protein BDV98DRAFT_574142 [Pterulicium gracile]|uniref:Uncharacterized protein n=1 Tax=Pterulicium gracile TaxID=1884261 RepID=A0A5C3Q6X3_9AGAR|nr:hypothetical protein BDV98DRAFT_574142 [Pterula gracilis]